MFKLFGLQITCVANCSREIMSRIAIAKAALGRMKTIVSTRLNLGKSEEESNKTLHLEYRFVRWWNLDTGEIRSEIYWKFWYVVLKEGG
jgi:hypothetical protein